MPDISPPLQIHLHAPPLLPLTPRDLDDCLLTVSVFPASRGRRFVALRVHTLCKFIPVPGDWAAGSSSAGRGRGRGGCFAQALLVLREGARGYYCGVLFCGFGVLRAHGYGVRLNDAKGEVDGVHGWLCRARECEELVLSRRMVRGDGEVRAWGIDGLGDPAGFGTAQLCVNLVADAVCGCLALSRYLMVLLILFLCLWMC